MIFHEDLRLSRRALLARPAESLLLAVAVALAVAATVAGVTLAATAATISERLLSSTRYREIAVTTTPRTAMEAPARKAITRRVELSIDDLERARSVTQAVLYAYLAEMAFFVVEDVGDPSPQQEHLFATKVTPEFFTARGLTPAAGSVFIPADMERGEPVMVVGSELGATLFEDTKALDRTVVADLRVFRIIGVLERTGTSVDEGAFIPAGFLRKNYRPSGGETTAAIVRSVGDDGRSLRFTVADRAMLGEARAQLAGYFDATYGEGLVYISDPRPEAHAVADRYRRMSRVIQLVAVSALLIAILNMSNIFSSRALRRRRSAGILKAMGAPRGRVFTVFFVEALVVGAIGSGAGMGLAAVLTGMMEREFGVGGLSPGLIGGGVAAAWVIVAVCSVLPAMSAARAPAAEAIRYE